MCQHSTHVSNCTTHREYRTGRSRGDRCVPTTGINRLTFCELTSSRRVHAVAEAEKNLLTFTIRGVYFPFVVEIAMRMAHENTQGKEEPDMKKLITVALCLSIAAAFGCKKKEEAPAPAPAPAAAPAPAPEQKPMSSAKAPEAAPAAPAAPAEKK